MTLPHKPDTPQERKELREKLAEIEHIRWSDWQKWMHSKMVEHSDGKGEWVCLPAELFRRWERQIATNYADLPAHEQASDMEQVDRYWPLIEQALQQARSDAIGEGCKALQAVVDELEPDLFGHDWMRLVSVVDNHIEQLKKEAK